MIQNALDARKNKDAKAVTTSRRTTQLYNVTPASQDIRLMSKWDVYFAQLIALAAFLAWKMI
jgi:hypothetical protein